MNKLLILLIAICLTTSLAWIPTIPKRSSLTKLNNQLKDAPIPDNETEGEMRERLRKKARKMMYNENGVAYAPWVAQSIDEDAIVEGLIRKEKGKNSVTTKTILDRGEIETSEGMKWRMVNNQVDLGWITGGESDNKGFIVEKRPSYGGDFQEIASFKEVTQLLSKGPAGGKYRYSDPSTAPGSWIYRVKDCDSKNKQNVLCQCFVEVSTDADNKSQAIILVGFVGLFIALFAAGVAIDPPR